MRACLPTTEASEGYFLQSQELFMGKGIFVALTFCNVTMVMHKLLHHFWS